MYRRRRRAVSLVFLVLAVLLLIVGQLISKDEDRLSRMTVVPAASALPAVSAPAASAVPAASALPAGSALPTGAGVATAAGLTGRPATLDGGPAGMLALPTQTVDAVPAWAAVGADTGFTFVGGLGPVLGTTGPIRRFKVAVQSGLGQGDGSGFAAVVDRVLGDPRSWIAGRQFRLQRVPHPVASEFTIYLASAEISEKMCVQGGLITAGFTSCRLPGRVVINMDRWAGAVPGYGAPLDVYRSYAINHEVGHQLGHGHEACPGRGRPAPVMMQQTYGLKGCVAYGWPYLEGRRYSGAPMA